MRTLLAGAAEENSDLAAGLWDCGEVAAHNPQTGPRREVAARSQGAAAAHTQKVGAACSPEAHPPLASTYGHADQDNTPAGRRAVQPLQEPLQVHLEHNSHKAHDESRRRSLQPPESHQIGQIATDAVGAACFAYRSLVVISRCGAELKNQMPPNRSTSNPTIARPPKNVFRPSDDMARPSAI